MRIVQIASFSIMTMAGASAAFAVNSPADDASGVVLRSTLEPAVVERTGILVPAGDVKPGETFTITGECVARLTSADSLRVVLTLADSTSHPGYHALLATEQEMQDDGLEVRVPNVPDEASRIFQVKIFRLGQDAPQICDAGSIRIDDTSGDKVG